MNATSPKLSLSKLGLYHKPKSLKVMVLGQCGVGKSALVVRFITRRYIGEYDPTLEKIYTFQADIDNEMVYFEILDTAGQSPEKDFLGLEANIRWAEAFILMYSVTDKCSFDECYRLKFLINYNKRKKRIGISDANGEVPVVLVGNKIDQVGDRMVSLEDGQIRSQEIGCCCFHEISVRESIEQVLDVFRDTCRFWRVHSRNPSKLKRSASDKDPESPDCNKLLGSNTVSPSSLVPCGCSPAALLGRKWTELDEEEENESESKDSSTSSPVEPAPFRERASTDGHLQQKPWMWRYRPRSSGNSTETAAALFRTNRRMSISMKGNNPTGY